MPRTQLDQLVAELDRINLKVAVNLSGGTGSQLTAGVKNMKGAYPKRFVIFANLSYEGIGRSRLWTKSCGATGRGCKEWRPGI
jgi:uncharacterized protein